jgi:hypothetical protein
MTCYACRLEIPADAVKCGHCGDVQPWVIRRRFKCFIRGAAILAALFFVLQVWVTIENNIEKPAYTSRTGEAYAIPQTVRAWQDRPFGAQPFALSGRPTVIVRNHDFQRDSAGQLKNFALVEILGLQKPEKAARGGNLHDQVWVRESVLVPTWEMPAPNALDHHVLD